MGWFSFNIGPTERDYFAAIKKSYRSKLEPRYGKPVGTSDREIAALEERIGHGLPIAYRQYLLWMGEHEEGRFRGSDCFMYNVERNKSVLTSLFADNNIEFNLPNDYVVFYTHQGYNAAWFELPNAQDDPVCWYFFEGHMKAPKVYGVFTKFIFDKMFSKLTM